MEAELSERAMDARALYNLLSTDDVVIVDVRAEEAFVEAHVCGAYRGWVGSEGQLHCEPAPGSAVPGWTARTCVGRPVVMCGDDDSGLSREHPVWVALACDGTACELLLLPAGELAAFQKRYGSLVCVGRALRLVGVREPHSAATRLLPSEVLQGRLFLCDLPAAAQLARKEVASGLRLAHAITVMAELPQEMFPVAEAARRGSGVPHTFFACHDASGADIKAHFARAHAIIDQAGEGRAVLIHCSKGVQHAAGGFCAVDLGSTHGSFINGQRLLPHAEVRFNVGDALTLGASSRSYGLYGLGARAQGPTRDSLAAAEVGNSDDEDDEGGDEAAANGRAGAGVQEPRTKRKKKWEKKSVRRLRQLVTQKPMTENEKVALRAGQGSGCFGPGFD
ncbi:hypothetical protein T492DRAFT_1086368 [Pavlovales sp. CCMP2436]|nr:hypothetical protein T492DRAFT_1086368 [Pavlovales sp. CCMP2436]